MLHYRPLRNNAGILLFSDYSTLRDVHDVIHEVNEKSPLIKDKEGLLLSLAYDIRKAYERQREIVDPPQHYPEIGPRFGVEQLWPTLLCQSRLLRQSLSWFDSTKKHQAVAYDLEYVVEIALKSCLGADADGVIYQFERLNFAHPFPLENFNSRGSVFCGWSKKERRLGLAGLMASLDPMYSYLYEVWTRQGAKHLVPPDVFESLPPGDDWPDPRW